MFRLAAASLAPFILLAQPPAGAPRKVDVAGISRKWLAVPYATTSPAQKLDIYLPDKGKGPFPVILSIHGGGFAFGDRRGPDLALALRARSRGFAIVSMDYRLSGEARFPACIEDVRAAIRFVRKHAGAYGLDPARVATWGSSAGGNLAALAGTSGKGDTAVQAVVDLYGPVNFLTMDAEFKASGVEGQSHDGAASFESKLLGAPIQTVQQLAKQANPATFISPSAPPFFIQHGTADRNIPPRQSEDLAAALRKAIGAGNVAFELLPGAGHGGPAFETDANVEKILAFLERHLKR